MSGFGKKLNKNNYTEDESSRLSKNIGRSKTF